MEKLLERLIDVIEKSTGFSAIDIFTFLSCALSIFAFVFSLYSWKCSVEKEKIRVALEFTKMYKDSMDDIAFITNVIYSHPEIHRLINKIDSNRMIRFNTIELKENYSNDEINKLFDFFNSSNKKNSPNADTIIKMCKYLNKDIFDTNISMDREDFDDETLVYYFQNKAKELLNTLEYFSMAFVRRTANDKMVYQSLHQSYFIMVKSLYFLISFNNTSEKDKYYTNIITLFKRWSEKESKFISVYIKENKKVEKAIQKANSRIENQTKYK